MSREYQITGDVLALTLEDGREVTFKNNKNVEVRQVNGQGYEIFLRDVKDIHFQVLPYGIHTTITSLKGVTYEKVIVFYE